MKHLQACLDKLFEEKTLNNVSIKAGIGGREICHVHRTSEKRVLTDMTLFDMASVTKIMVTAPLAFVAMDRGLLSTEDKISRFFAVPPDKSEMTVGHLMTHTMGIGHKYISEHKDGYGSIQNYILNIPLDIPIGTDVRYSCPGFIILGRIVEELLGDRLDRLFLDLVAGPLGMTASSFLPDKAKDAVNSRPVEGECGVASDSNCRHLGGICGNAGLFSCISDVTKYVNMLMSGGERVFSKETLRFAIKNHTKGMSESRGLGFLYVDGRYKQTGGLFPDGAFGHCGHSGQSVFLHPESGLYVIILSDATLSTIKKYGAENYVEVMKMREDIHRSIKEDLKLI